MRQIDAQLQALQPDWGEKDYDGERKMLYDMMGDDEHIERLSAGSWKVLQRGRAMESHDRGIVAATGRGVVFLNKGRPQRERGKNPLPGYPGSAATGARRVDRRNVHESLLAQPGPRRRAGWLISSVAACPRMQRPWRTACPTF